MANNSDLERWYFTKEQIVNSPSVKDGIKHAKELWYRQQCANLIQDIGQRLQVPQLVINTAIVYMHRFYMLQSFSMFKRNTMGPCFLFLAAKVEEEPRRLQVVHVLKVTHSCLNKDGPPFDPKGDDYMKTQQELVDNESVLLQTLGFEVDVDHPNTYVVNEGGQLVKASKEFQQTACFLASNSLHLTTFCIQYKPTVVACVCIYVACLWAHCIIPETQGKNWYKFIDNNVTRKMLDELASHYIKILDSCPTRLKQRLHSRGATVYKDGKVVKKESTSASSSNKGTKETLSSSGKLPSTITAEVNDKNNNLKPNLKSPLKGLLKSQPHVSTPSPNRGHASSSSLTPSSSTSKTAHQKKYYEHRSSSDPLKKMLHTTTHGQHQAQSRVDSPHNKVRVSEARVRENRVNEASPKMSSLSKTHEQSKIEQRKKWTPQQIEDYNKHKEKEKLLGMQQQRRRDGDRNEREPGIRKKVDDASARLKRPHADISSPMKRQRLNEHPHKP